MAKLPTIVKDNLNAERSHWMELRDKADSVVIDARVVLAKARKERATAEDMLAGLNRALGLREDGSERNTAHGGHPMSDTILSKAGDDLAEQGRLVDWHCKRMEDRAHRYAAQYAAVNAEIADLSERLQAATATLLDLEARQEREDAWDWAHLLDWFLHAPQHVGMKARSLKLSRGYTIGARKQAAKLNILDDAYLMTALPDCTETVTKLKGGEAKKRLTVTENGRVVFADTGELLPEGIVEVERLEGDSYYIKAPDAIGEGETTHTIRAGLGDLPEDAEEDE